MAWFIIYKEEADGDEPPELLTRIWAETPVQALEKASKEEGVPEYDLIYRYDKWQGVRE